MNCATSKATKRRCNHKSISSKESDCGLYKKLLIQKKGPTIRTTKNVWEFFMFIGSKFRTSQRAMMQPPTTTTEAPKLGVERPKCGWSELGAKIPSSLKSVHGKTTEGHKPWASYLGQIDIIYDANQFRQQQFFEEDLGILRDSRYFESWHDDPSVKKLG